MRRVSKVDDNQADIVADLRRAGVSVQPLHSVGGGVPDLLCGLAGRNVLIEVKDGDKFASARTLTKQQVDWHDSWRGQVAVAKNSEDALKIMGLL